MMKNIKINQASACTTKYFLSQI